ncbi:MAG: RNA methyltransferase [Candidatus Omnitrophica bacterium]|nr:RNA methyltransferase [Candidatus Omnitrophota bacterium]
MKKFTHEEIVNRQSIRQSEPLLSFDVVLNDIRSLHNVGSIFRTCDGVGIRKLWLCGITGYPPQSQISKTAIGAEDRVDWEYARDVLSVVEELKQQNYQIVILEQTDQCYDYYDFIPRKPVCLVVGNEIDGISEELLPFVDDAIDIYMKGIKNSLNVSVAFGIAAYHIRHHFV